MRVWITWGEVEREDGVFDFSYTDKIVEKAQENDILLLITVMPFAEWDQDMCRGDECYGKMPMLEGITTMKVCKPCSMDDYIEFLKKFVERYDGDGVDDMPGLKYPIKYWEIMNEPSMRGLDVTQLKFFYGSPQDYLEILKSSYAAIKESDPEAKVVMGGMAGMHKQFREFWGQIISEAGNYFDVANIHSIDTSERREDMFVLSFKQFLEEHGVENKPIWITEAQFGKLEEPLPPDELDPLVLRATVLSLAFGADKIFYISDNWIYKETFQMYKTLVKKLNDFEKVEVVDQDYIVNKKDDEGVTSLHGCYKFIGHNKTIYVVWGEGSLSRYLNGTVKVTDIYGNERIAEASEIQLTSVPIYVEKLDEG